MYIINYYDNILDNIITKQFPSPSVLTGYTEINEDDQLICLLLFNDFNVFISIKSFFFICII
jgi:hypothetical protein